MMRRGIRVASKCRSRSGSRKPIARNCIDFSIPHDAFNNILSFLEPNDRYTLSHVSHAFRAAVLTENFEREALMEVLRLSMYKRRFWGFHPMNGRFNARDTPHFSFKGFLRKAISAKGRLIISLHCLCARMTRLSYYNFTCRVDMDMSQRDAHCTWVRMQDLHKHLHDVKFDSHWMLAIAWLRRQTDHSDVRRLGCQIFIELDGALKGEPWTHSHDFGKGLTGDWPASLKQIFRWSFATSPPTDGWGKPWEWNPAWIEELNRTVVIPEIMRRGFEPSRPACGMIGSADPEEHQYFEVSLMRRHDIYGANHCFIEFWR
eukprot:Blabericola_migrator_1__12939@NODE_854_length_6247_cov_104_237702_g605_i0_p2_GENE_NODE_854_length_6247_cov_104_237702_g605_i0NODE_854_length_6247_cov_104_237702_g605_i0_p2_ORF_typecomplete_len317_score26_43Fboxlike/PF12937_7/0_0002Fbox/PF00646_33/0_0032_NODE_854_length_6247_cov_104_237702_g605_i01971147